jgi:hypothetical protein
MITGKGGNVEILYKDFLDVEIELFLVGKSDFDFERAVKKKGVKFSENVIKIQKGEMSYHLTPENYEEMIQSFFNVNTDFVYRNDEKLLQLLKLYAVGYFIKKFKNKLKEDGFPLLPEILAKKKSEFKNIKI